MTWKPLILALFLLLPMGCKKAPECPRLSLHRFNLDGVADSVLWQYDEIYSGASVAEVERRQQRARQAGHDAWADNCRWLHQLTGCLAIKYYAGTLPRWMTRDRHENPDRMLACMAHDNEWAGCEWFLKDDQGAMIPVWPSRHPAMLLNLGPGCPKGVVGDTEGLTVVEYMCGPWLDVFLETRWKNTYDGMTIESGPFPAVRCWGEGMDEILIVPGTGIEPMTCRQYRAYAFPHYSRFLTDCIGVLTRKGIITRCNGHFDYEVCEWQNPLLIEHAQLVHANFSGCKLEHFGNWGGCPKSDLLEWTEILFRIEGHFRPPHWDEYQGWDVSCLECGVRDQWSVQRVNNWQRATLAAALMGETTWNVKCKDNQNRIIPFGPHALFQLGKPLGPARALRDHAGLNPVYYRHFKRGGKVYTVAWNPGTHPNATIPARDGEWFEGKWPSGEYKKLDIK